MKKNIGNIDKFIRLLIATVIVALYVTEIISGTLGFILLLVAAVLIFTSLISLCPFYKLLGLSTRKRKHT